MQRAFQGEETHGLKFADLTKLEIGMFASMIAALVLLGGSAAPLAWLLCRLPGAPWWAELPAHWVELSLPAVAFGAVVFLLDRVPPRRRVGAVIAAVSVGQPFLTPWLAARPASGAIGPTVLVANVHTDNRDYASLLSLARQHDVVGLLEVDEAWLAAVRAGLPDHALLAARPRADNFGVALLSRRPGDLARVVRLGTDLPSIEARLSVSGAPVTLLLTHPLPPISEEYRRDRDVQLTALAAEAVRLGPAVAVAGDLNVTRHVPAFAPLVDAGLTDARVGHGRLASWPAPLGPLGIAIDHLLLGAGLAAPTLDAVAFGSDHRALRFTLALRADGPRGG